MKAAVIQENHTVAVQDVPKPRLTGSNDVLIRATAWGLNPTDWKHAAWISPPGSRAGCDAVGIVEEVGANVPKDLVGQRRAMFMMGNRSPDNGAFAEYFVQDAAMTWQVPSQMSDEEAATMPIPFFTACQVLFQRMRLPEPQTHPAPSDAWVLVYSGASSVGQYAIQLAKHAGFKVITTASPQREARLKGKLGADIVVDYRSDDLAQKLKTATNDGIEKAFDCFSESTSMKTCHDALSSSKGGEVVCILPFDASLVTRKDVKVSFTVIGTYITNQPGELMGAKFEPAGPNDRQDAERIFKTVPQYIVDNQFTFLQTYIMQGIEKIPEGLGLLRDGQVHGQKIVVKA